MDPGTEICIICKKCTSVGELALIKQERGAIGINNASKLRGVEITAQVGDTIHLSCRQRFIDKKDIALFNNRKMNKVGENISWKRSSRATSCPFNRQTDCIFCTQLVDFSNKYQPSCSRSECVSVKTASFSTTIKDICEKRNDNWCLEVKGRLEYFQHDLFAADCVYHRSCSTNFRTGKDIPYQYRKETPHSYKKAKLGRPENEIKKLAFLKLCSYLEENDDLNHTFIDLRSKMKDFLEVPDEEPYDVRWMKEKLKEHFGDSIQIYEEEGQPSIVILRESVHSILNSYYKTQRSQNENLEKVRIIETAARLIKSDVMGKRYDSKDFYPAADEIDLKTSLKYLPDTLKLMCSKIFTGSNIELKTAAIGQCIVQACRPRAVIAPMQLSLAIQMHSHFRSKYLVETLHSLGFCSSYSEVKKFERSAALATDGNLIDAVGSKAVLFAADNIDHNIRTLTGENTFHGMGMIASITPTRNFPKKIPRKDTSDDYIKELAKVRIHNYINVKNSLMDIKFTKLPPLEINQEKTDLLWMMAWHFKPDTPNWSGTMKGIHTSLGIDKASVIALPILDLQPSDVLYSHNLKIHL